MSDTILITIMILQFENAIIHIILGKVRKREILHAKESGTFFAALLILAIYTCGCPFL